MSTYETTTITVTSATNGTATSYTKPMVGLIERISYAASTTAQYATTAQATISVESDGEVLWYALLTATSQSSRPSRPLHDVFGRLGAAAVSKIAVPASRVKVALTNGGDTKSGTFTFVVAGTIAD